ncbi:hypothetical protein ACR6C2_03490 [Streptomyces sp. INA 01156]
MTSPDATARHTARGARLWRTRHRRGAEAAITGDTPAGRESTEHRTEESDHTP